MALFTKHSREGYRGSVQSYLVSGHRRCVRRLLISDDETASPRSCSVHSYGVSREGKSSSEKEL